MINTLELNNLAGVILGKFHSDVLIIDLPLITETRVIKQGKTTVEKSTRQYGEFCFSGDFHYGNSVFSEAVMHGYLNYLIDHPNIQLGFMGDIIECAQLSQFIAEENIMDIDKQIEAFCKDWGFLSSRVKFALWGNHEERQAQKSKTKSFMKNIIKYDLGAVSATIPDPQRGLFIVFKAGTQEYGCYVHHSKTSARVNQDIQLARSGSQNVTSIIAHGHTHRLGWKPRTFFELTNDNNNFYTLVRRQYLLSTGCFLEYPSYAEANSMPLTECGAPIIKFYADEHELGYYDLTMTYHNYIKYDSAGAGSEHFDHTDIHLKHSYQSPYAENKKCLL